MSAVTRIMSIEQGDPQALEAMSPVTANERIDTLDVLRGFALFGILWMNIPELPDAFGSDARWHNRIVGWLGMGLASGKFVALYSFLFGLGFAVQLLRAEARGARIVPVYVRRLLALLAIGLAHAVFLWQGDILRDYAILGFLLLLFRKCSPRTLLVCALLSLAWAEEGERLVDTVSRWRRPDPEAVRVAALDGENYRFVQAARAGAVTRAEQRGTYTELAAARAAMLPGRYSNWRLYFDGENFCMFLLGLYAGRRRIFQNVSAHLPFLRRVMWWGLALGLTLNVADVAMGELSGTIGLDLPGHLGRILVYAVGRPALCLFYISAITLAMQNVTWKRRLGPLAWPGRMGLTNYLLQSLIFTTLFYGYGLGLLPYASKCLALGLTLIIWPVQMILSRWWLKRFRFGPMEWLWRTMTYAKVQPMRLKEVAA